MSTEKNASTSYWKGKKPSLFSSITRAQKFRSVFVIIIIVFLRKLVTCNQFFLMLHNPQVPKDHIVHNFLHYRGNLWSGARYLNLLPARHKTKTIKAASPQEKVGSFPPGPPPPPRKPACLWISEFPIIP